LKERYEFRLPDTEARSLLRSSVEHFPLLSGETRVVRVNRADPLFDEIGQAELRRLGKGHRAGLFYSWDVRRSYRRAELDQAELIHVIPSGAFEPAGEDCGTKYDESAACPHCGAGRIQVSPLALDLRRSQPEHDIDTTTLRRGKDVARSIADEIVVSDRLAMLLQGAGISGFDLPPVHKCNRDVPIRGWLQLRVTGMPVEAAPPTEYGKNPFDLDEAGEYPCPLGHVAGLNLLSELTIDRRSWRGADIVVTRQLVGLREGALVPAPSILISPRLFRLMRENRVRGVRYEVAHLS
jgi:hypothetical protein